MKKIRRKRGLRARRLNILLFVITLMMSNILIYSNSLLKNQYRLLQAAEDDYKSSMDYSKQLQAASDNLTMNVWHFVETADVSYINAYFEEIDSKRRERALEELNVAEEQKAPLANAIDISDRLMSLECHIMHLVVSAKGIDESLVRSEVLDYNLSVWELSLTPEQKLDKARELAFGTVYSGMKKSIDKEIERFSNMALTSEQETVFRYIEEVDMRIKRQQFFIVLLIIIVALVAFTLNMQIVVVLQKFVKRITMGMVLEEEGVYELRYLAEIYNEMMAKRLLQEKELQHKAETDALTGIMNRGQFEESVRSAMSRGDVRKMAFMIIDVDKFKEINDKYGHDAGDRVLRLVASVLAEEFGRDGFIGRLGGDEFAIFFENIIPEASGSIEESIRRINRRLMKEKSDVIMPSVSAGLAFGREEDDFPSLYKRADEALYHMKESGRGGCMPAE